MWAGEGDGVEFGDWYPVVAGVEVAVELIGGDGMEAFGDAVAGDGAVAGKEGFCVRHFQDELFKGRDFVEALHASGGFRYLVDEDGVVFGDPSSVDELLLIFHLSEAREGFCDSIISSLAE